jgi:hypothetical protein
VGNEEAQGRVDREIGAVEVKQPVIRPHERTQTPGESGTSRTSQHLLRECVSPARAEVFDRARGRVHLGHQIVDGALAGQSQPRCDRRLEVEAQPVLLTTRFRMEGLAHREDELDGADQTVRR